MQWWNNYCQHLSENFCVLQNVWLHQWHTTRHDICCCLFVVFHIKLNSRPSTCRQHSSPVAFLIKNSYDLGSRSRCVRIEHVEPMQRSKSKGLRKARSLELCNLLAASGAAEAGSGGKMSKRSHADATDTARPPLIIPELNELKR